MDEQNRPDPDALLASIKEKHAQEGKGKLKIFFGMSAGVGKTYTMLEAAQALKAKGVNLMVGLVETHGRKETEALLKDLPVIPRQSLNYRGIQIQEMDLDAILRLKPEYVLVDELAHTNAEGVRHKKRYQDVLEILDNEINVFSTLNVQHVESLVDTVQQITGITVRETVPDSIIDNADEIELIDISPTVLLQRLSEGKVYAPDRSEAALMNFFHKGNLTALREIALRRTAQRVDSQLLDYMQENKISGPWKTVERLMVAVGPSPYSEQIIRWTRRIASNLEAPWVAVYVQTTGQLTEDAEKTLRKNIAFAQELGADLVTTIDDDIVKALIRTARENNVTQIVIGKSKINPVIDLLHGGSLVTRLIKESGSIDINVIQGDTPELQKKPRILTTSPVVNSSWRQYALAGLSIMITAIVCQIASPIIDYRSIGMFLLFIVVLLSLFVGTGPILFAASIGAVVWDFLFIPPRLTFTISHRDDLLLILLFFIVAIVTGSLTSRIRRQQQALRRREQQFHALYSLVADLSSAESVDDIAEIAVKQITREFNCSIVCYFSDLSTELTRKPHTVSTFLPLTEKEWSVAEWVFRNRKPAGRGSDTLPFAQAAYYPLLSFENCLGVIGIIPSSGQLLSFDKENTFQMFLHQLAQSLERLHLRSDRLNKTLLRSISHELRTPIATIIGASSGLSDPETSANQEVSKALIDDIMIAAKRLNRLVKNLLDMTRIESGALQVQKEWCDIRDLFNTVRANLQNELASHTVTISIQNGMPLIELDAVLIEQAISNLAINSTQYSPENTAIAMNATYDAQNLFITIEDDGPGFPPDTLPCIFEKFYRVPGTKAGGTGLGLSIVKGFIEYHGGTVEAMNRPNGGARLTIRLPIFRSGTSGEGRVTG